MSGKFLLTFTFFGLLAPGILCAESTPAQALLVLSKSDGTLAIVEPSTLKVVARIPVGPDPHEVIASDDGKLAYVSNYGGGAYNTIAVVDLVEQKALPAIDLGSLRGPHGLEFGGGKVWFTAEAAKVIGSYDPSVNRIDWVLGTSQNRTHMIFVTGDLKQIVTANVNSGTMSIFERVGDAGAGRGSGGPVPGRGAGGPPQADWNESVISVGKGPEGFDVSPDGREIWVANAHDGTVSVIDFAGKVLIQTFDARVVGANRLKFTPDGKKVFISMLRGSDLAVIDAATKMDVKRLSIGHGSAGILMQPDGTRAYVACTPDNYVTVIDLHTLEATGRLDAGRQPDGLAWAVRR
jgi:YVTN family beta-propeller protein